MQFFQCSVAVRSACLAAVFACGSSPDAGAQSPRITSGLVALYDFSEANGDIVGDRSGVGAPLNLRIADTGSVRRTAGELEVRGNTLIQSDGPATKIIDAVRQSGAISIEAWIRPADTGLSGPARIVTISRDTGQRNVTLGQDGDKYDVRLRTTSTSTNGIPSLASEARTLSAELTHIVYTHDRRGRTRIYVNGELLTEESIDGSVSNWDESFSLALANELSGDRPWRGTYYLVAVYNRDLRPQDVEQNFRAGHEGSPRAVVSAPETEARASAGLLALYDFTESDGDVIRDRSGAGEPIDLRIPDGNVVRRTDGALEVRADTLIRSEGPATRISETIRRTGEITIEAWLRPADTGLSGPARIVTLSEDPVLRNFTLGQDGEKYDVRLRTTSTSLSGTPSLSATGGSLTRELTHVVYTHDRNGRTRIYVNGELNTEGTVEGDTSNWDDSFRVGLANEMTGDRPWRGTYYLVAIYGRGLLPREVVQNFRAGFDAAPPIVAEISDTGSRAGGGLLALYDFNEPDGTTIHDRSGSSAPLDLEIADPDAVRRRDGALEVRGQTLIQSATPAVRINDAIGRTGEVSIEAWIRPADVGLSGPARIVTLSANTTERNFTLGQEGDAFDFRLRTTSTSTNGIPSLSAQAGSVKTELTHVVYTHAGSSRSRIYVNGELNTEETIEGPATNWDRSFRLGLADELSGGRPWRGTYYLVALYGRELSPREVIQNFRAGPDGRTLPAESTPTDGLFYTKIAPLLARHCFECHDTATREGGLDLSRQVAALEGGDSGKAIQPGNSGASLLWELVAADEMPAERTSLSDEEKALLRQWIDAGADWPIEFIDPLVYGREQRAPDNLLRRLTVSEYIETVKHTVGVDIAEEARRILPPDLRADGFSNTAYNLNVDLGHVEAYAELARIIVERMDVGEFARKYANNRRLEDDNMRDFVTRLGKWLFRGPLEEHEIVNYRGISSTVASAGGGFEEAAGYTIEAMLQSPRFIYRIENQRGDGSAWPVGDFELASRLSYIIWGGPPDEELLRAAEQGDFYDRAGIEAQVRRMLQNPRAIDRSVQFVSEWLNLARLDNLQPNSDHFPDWDPALADDMRAETLAFFNEVAWEEDRPLSDLLNAQVTFATPRLARHYGLKPAGEGLRQYDLSGTPRGGLLTQGSVLTVGGDEASMVTRGLFVLHDFLRGTVKDPPPCVDTTPVPTEPGLTQRGIAEARIANEACGGCHGKFEPLAFGLEKFDGLGSYQERDDHGNQLRDDGEILIPGAAAPVPYASSAELMDLLAGSDRVKESLTWKVTQFALGRPLGAADAPVVEEIHQTAQRNGGTYSALISAVVLSDLVLTTRTESVE